MMVGEGPEKAAAELLVEELGISNAFDEQSMKRLPCHGLIFVCHFYESLLIVK